MNKKNFSNYNNLNFFKGKKVLITGHTGFKGSWLTAWLKKLGAKIMGISIDIPSHPSHFIAAKIGKDIISKKIDIRDLKKLKKNIKQFQPDYVFHLAAQSLVSKSYKDPIKTWSTNVQGTLNILESLRTIKKKCVAVIITSDKSYKNLELKRGYRENDILGGKDPYSASKASAELVIKSYIESFFPIKKTKVKIGIARAGNVIGGGDWAENRLIPDCVRSWSKGKKAIIRNPNSTRPWQHVLEAVSGYLYLGINLDKNIKLHGEAFNFGPNTSKDYSVLSLVKTMQVFWKDVVWKIYKGKGVKFYESNLLKLNCKKAKQKLKWVSILNFRETIQMVSEWYKNYYLKKNKMDQLTFKQIKNYEFLVKKRGLS